LRAAHFPVFHRSSRRYVYDRRYVEALGKRRQEAAAYVRMATDEFESDDIGSKGPGLAYGGDALGGLADEAATAVVEVTGVIKWFDVAKGYGFIVPDNGMPDVLLHVTCLRRDGFQTAYEGARVVCEALARPKGLQAFRVVSMDETTAVHPAQMPPPRTHVSVTATSGLERAVVKWFNRLRGFGFLTRGEGTPDIFVHMETLRRYGVTELRPGQTVLVRFGPGPKGLMAAEVRPDGGPHAFASH
jgi:CspA family cold shock protein